MRTVHIASFLALAAGCCAASHADIASVTTSRDNTLYESQFDVSNGIGPTMFAGKNNRNERRRALMFFDLSMIPAGATINSVELTLSMTQTSGGAIDVAVHQLLASFGEGSSNGGEPGGSGVAATSGDATWRHRFFDGTLWGTAGGDFNAAASASRSVGAIGSYSWSGSGLAADVQSWVDSPASNFGWVMLGNEAVNGAAKRFATREDPRPDFQPRLVIDYTVVPAPASLALIGAVGAWASRRRRG